MAAHMPIAKWQDWQAHLDTGIRRHVMGPLRGTEKERYNEFFGGVDILAQARQEKEADGLILRQLLKRVENAQFCVDCLVDAYDHMPPKLLHRGRGRPRKDAPPTIEQALEAQTDLEEARSKLSEHIDKIDHDDVDEVKQLNIMATYPTEYGLLKACAVLPASNWYGGHQPGDPIYRVKGIGPSKGMFYHPEPKHRLHFQGIVPFSHQATKARFDIAFPNFIDIIEVIMLFMAKQPSYEKLLAVMFNHIHGHPKKSVKDVIPVLLDIWKTEVNIDARKRENWPQFLEEQLTISRSRFQEMGWLMSKMERAEPKLAEQPNWKPCKELLEILTGFDTHILAQQYFDDTLAAEAFGKLESGDTENFFFYVQSKDSRKKCRLQDFYDAEPPVQKPVYQTFPADTREHISEVADYYLQHTNLWITSLNKQLESYYQNPASQVRSTTTSSNSTPGATTPSASKPSSAQPSPKFSHAAPPAKKEREETVAAESTTNAFFVVNENGRASVVQQEHPAPTLPPAPPIADGSIEVLGSDLYEANHPESPSPKKKKRKRSDEGDEEYQPTKRKPRKSSSKIALKPAHRKQQRTADTIIVGSPQPPKLPTHHSQAPKARSKLNQSWLPASPSSEKENHNGVDKAA
ncbi:hypothetical protein F5Y16DRAFT_421469 [Xylariaceae sp. FL0255]|nr:hypothetical protein F5Y16DRAFT_421469 [Xylariaceae sp. FL0255]